jgi:hypothetical protein
MQQSNMEFVQCKRYRMEKLYKNNTIQMYINKYHIHKTRGENYTTSLINRYYIKPTNT